VPGIVLLAFFAAAPVTAASKYPGAFVAFAIVFVAFVVSAVALTRLGRPTLGNTRRLWLISLISNLTIIAVVVIELGVKLGLALCMMELITIVLHVFALAAPPGSAQDT
jgi:magnesium-transporting ATPase (P-type)